MKKLISNSPVHTHSTSDVMDITTYLIAQVRYFIDKRNLGCKKCICSILAQFRRLERGDQNRRFNQIKGPVKVPHDCNRLFIATPDYDTVRTHKVIDRGAFSKKLRVRNDAEICLLCLIITN